MTEDSHLYYFCHMQLILFIETGHTRGGSAILLVVRPRMWLNNHTSKSRSHNSIINIFLQ